MFDIDLGACAPLRVMYRTLDKFFLTAMHGARIIAPSRCHYTAHRSAFVCALPLSASRINGGWTHCSTGLSTKRI
jgi:hypothetical protein